VVGEIDLRIFLDHWRYAFEVTEQTSCGPRRSLQFFDPRGVALHKVHATRGTDQGAWSTLVEGSVAPDQPTTLDLVPPTPTPEKPDAEIDAEGLRAAWRAMTDTHEFFGILRRFGVTRPQSFRLVGAEFTTPLPTASFEGLLRAAAAGEVPIMIFVNNPGIVQIYTGPVRNITTLGPWLNIMDPTLNLHVLPAEITDAWVVRKPTADGLVTSLEFYAAGELVTLLFGRRKPGIPEDERWRALLAALAS
jgi:putative hemin transport protein